VVGILNFNLELIYELSGKQPLVKTIVSFVSKLQPSNVKNSTKIIRLKFEEKKKHGGTPGFFQFSTRNFYGIFIVRRFDQSKGTKNE